MSDRTIAEAMEDCEGLAVECRRLEAQLAEAKTLLANHEHNAQQQYQSVVDERNAMAERLKLYQQALTDAIQLPMGVLPDSENYETVMKHGLCVIKGDALPIEPCGQISYALEGAEVAHEDIHEIALDVAGDFPPGTNEGIVTLEQFKKLPSFDIRVIDKGDGVKWEYVEGEGE